MIVALETVAPARCALVILMELTVRVRGVKVRVRVNRSFRAGIKVRMRTKESSTVRKRSTLFFSTFLIGFSLL